MNNALYRTKVSLFVFYFIVAFISKPSFPFIDVPEYWLPAIKAVLQGHPLDIYSVRVAHSNLPGLELPNVHLPLAVYLLVPFVWLAERLGFSDFYGAGAAIVGIPLLLFDILCANELLRFASDYRPGLSRRDALLLIVMFLFSPFLWFTSVYMQHQESLVLLAFLLGYHEFIQGRDGQAGLFWGIMMMAKLIGLVFLVPIFVYLVHIKAHRRLLVIFGLIGVLLVITTLPFFIYNFENAYYSLIKFESLRPIFGITIYKFFRGTSLEPYAVRYANYVLLGALFVLSYWLVVKRGWTPTAVDSTGPALFLLCSLVFLLLCKWVYYHYVFLSLSLFILWELVCVNVHRGSFPLYSFLFVFAMCGIQSQFPMADVAEKYYPVVLLRCLLNACAILISMVFVYRMTNAYRGEKVV